MVAILFQAAGNMLLSTGMKSVGMLMVNPAGWPATIWAAAQLPEIWLGVGCMVAFVIMFTMVLSWTDLSLALPIVSIDIVLNVACAHWVLGEDVPLSRWAGTALVAAGAGLVASTARKSQPPAAP